MTPDRADSQHWGCKYGLWAVKNEIHDMFVDLWGHGERFFYVQYRNLIHSISLNSKDKGMLGRDIL